MLTRSQKLNPDIKSKDKLVESIENIIPSRSQKLDSHTYSQNITNDIDLKSKKRDKWLHDYFIDAYFNDFSLDISKSRNDTLLIGPSVSQILKQGSSFQVLEIATSLNLDTFNYIFFCVSDSIEVNNSHSYKCTNKSYSGTNGSHWSLIFINRLTKKTYHFDSIKGLNNKHATKLSNNVTPNYSFSEVNTPQQTGSFECGMHVIINTKYLLNAITNHDLNIYEEFKNCVKINETTQTNVSLESLNKKNDNFMPLETKQHTTSNENKPTYIHSVDSKVKTINNAKIKKSKKNHKLSLSKLNCDKQIEPSKNIPTVVESDLIIETPLNRDQNCMNNQNPTGRPSLTPINKSITNNFEVKKALKRLIILSDSHGKGLASKLCNKMENFSVSSFVYPGATLTFLTNKINMVSKSMAKDDILLIIGGSNDISNNPRFNIKPLIDSCLNHTYHNKVLLLEIPFRYDLQGCNNSIRRVNRFIKDLIICYENQNCSQISLNVLSRKDYSRHGLHLNERGKNHLCSIINNHVQLRYSTPSNGLFKPIDNIHNNWSSTSIATSPVSHTNYNDLKIINVDSRIQSFPIEVIITKSDSYFLGETSIKKEMT